MKLARILLYVGLMVACTQPLLAQPNFSREAHIARLDEAAGEPSRNKLAELVFKPQSSEEGMANLDWLGARFIRGDSAFFAYAYARVLVGVASELPADKANDLNGTALAAMIYAVAASHVDGLQCADITGRGNRAEQFVSELRRSGLLDLVDEPTRRKAAYIANAVEQKSWLARRTNNDATFQCWNGMAAIKAGIQAGLVTESAPEPGKFGRQVKVSPPAGFVYERRDDADWWVDAEKARSQLPLLMAKLAGIDQIPSGSEIDALKGKK